MLRLIIVLCVSLGFFSGCGPIESTSHIIKADTALHNARTANAQKKSPYEFTAAEQYLRKARQMWGSSDFEHAIDYAKKAKETATIATENSLKSGDEQ